MIGALWTGISGLSSHQTALDNESHNIANVNTVGYKASRISFADQMYQDRIGKGSKILDAEKLYVQGNLKLTGVDYDMALSGDGFFTVKDSISGENMYTRAGNLRMGDNGTLQDAAGNEVQGWPMRAIDPAEDVTSTNPNIATITSDYTKLLTSKVINYSTYIETVTAKATDYTSTAMADASTVFEGAGAKSKSAKIADIEALVSNYSSWLSRLQDNPDGGSASSTAQVSQINFKSGTDGLISKDGDQAYVYIDGNKYSQNYIATTATDEFKEDFLSTSPDATANLTFAVGATNDTITIDTAEPNGKYVLNIGGETITYFAEASDTTADIATGLENAMRQNTTLMDTVASGTVYSGMSVVGNVITLSGHDAGTPTTQSFSSSLDINADIAASRIATYRGLADTISGIAGLRAYMVSEDAGLDEDVLEGDESFSLSTYNLDMIKGILQIESLIPGETFTISEVGESSGTNTVAGSYQVGTNAVEGSGIGALQSAREALAEAITGKQQDVYTPSDLGLNGSNVIDFVYGITIFDKDIGQSIPVPGTNSTTPATPYKLQMDNITSIDDLVAAINSPSTTVVDDNGVASTSSFVMSDYVKAFNINGNLVIQTLDENYDVEFSSGMEIGEVDASYAGSITNNLGTNDRSTLDLSSIVLGNADYQLSFTDGNGSDTLNINNPTSLDDIATAINAYSGTSTLTATVSGNNIIIDTDETTTGFSGAFTLSTNGTGSYSPIDKNNDYSGRQGAGAEFIELVNTIDQTTTQDSLQLKLDALGISDSAFGEFSVDSSGVITMKQDGAEFAIGQISVALFNNNRGLEPSGDNLLAKTNESGEPIYNLNNEKTAKIEGQTLELSTADLSESLVNLMVFQRAFEANAKSITTSDELLNTLINLKR